MEPSYSRYGFPDCPQSITISIAKATEKRGPADGGVGVGASYECASGLHYGTHRYVISRLVEYQAHYVIAGHSGEVFATRFDATGQHIASGSMDRSLSMLRPSEG